MEKRMWQSEQKLIDTQGKLTSANLELQKLRGAADTCAHDLSMAKRIQERERERSPLLAELASLREQLRATQAKGSGSGGGRAANA